MVAKPRRWFVFSILTLLSVIVTCHRPEPPQTIIISNAPSFRPSDPTEIKSIQDELAAVITVCRDDLDLPVVDPLKLYLYKTSASLTFYTGRGSYAHMSGFAQANEIHVDREKVGDRLLVAFLAHEYAHTIQNRIVDSESVPFFMTEGFADWIAAKVLHVLKWQDFGITTHQIRRELMRQRDLLPDINLLYENNVSWVSTLKQPMGNVRAYNLAFLTMDQLIQEKGLAAVIAYQRSGDFKTTFGIPLRQVAAKIENSLVEKTPKKASFNATRPEWKSGYKWTYVRNESGSVATIVNEVVGEEVFRGSPVFVVRSLDEEILYDKEDFTALGARKKGNLVTEVDKTTGFLSWPLQPRKEWRVTLIEKNLVKNSALQYDQFMVVTGLEKVRLGAGEFEAIKIEAYGAFTGRLRAEYWYSPKIKWIVKTRIYSDTVGATEEELSRFELNERRSPIS